MVPAPSLLRSVSPELITAGVCLFRASIAAGKESSMEHFKQRDSYYTLRQVNRKWEQFLEVYRRALGLMFI